MGLIGNGFCVALSTEFLTNEYNMASLRTRHEKRRLLVGYVG